MSALALGLSPKRLACCLIAVAYLEIRQGVGEGGASLKRAPLSNGAPSNVKTPMANNKLNKTKHFLSL